MDAPKTPDRLSNGGPPLDDDTPPWGPGRIDNYFEWAAAKKKAIDAPYDTSQSVGIADARLLWGVARQEGHEACGRMARCSASAAPKLWA